MVIPPVLREEMLGELHWEHLDKRVAKAIACTCVWWPKMEEDIEEGYPRKPF